MTLRRSFVSLIRDGGGAGAAEFALVLPLLILFLLGIIDIGRLMYVTNMAEKATQMGARFAVVTNVLPANLATADYTNVVACPDPNVVGAFVACQNGDRITKTSALGKLVCTSTSCTCTGTCPSSTMDAAAFGRLVTHMKNFYPAIGATNVVVTYAGSGLGFAGDPTGMDVIPLVTVSLRSLTFKPITLFSTIQFNLPSFPTTLTEESALGNYSN